VEAAVWGVVLKVLSIIGAVATIALGILAIWLSLYFYRRSNEINNAIVQMLSRIEASSKTTEVTSSRFTGRLLDAVTGNLDRAGLERIEEKLTLRILERIRPVLKSAPQHVSKEAAKGVQEELAELFTTLKVEAAPTSLDYDWGPFIRKIDELESKRKFLAVKWLNEKVFAGDPTMQEALQVAAKNGILQLYKKDNPTNAAFPTTACQLAREHPTVKRILKAS